MAFSYTATTPVAVVCLVQKKKKKKRKEMILLSKLPASGVVVTLSVFMSGCLAVCSHVYCDSCSVLSPNHMVYKGV